MDEMQSSYLQQGGESRLEKKSIIALTGYNFLYYSLFSIISFLPLYLSSVKLGESQIGILLGIGPLFMIIVPALWGFLSDKIGRIKEVLLFILIASLIVGFILFKMESFRTIALLLSIFYLFFAAVMPLTDSLTFRLAHHSNVSFGSIRLYGSVGFSITSVYLGYILTKYGSSVLANLFLIIGILSIFILAKVNEKSSQSNTIVKNPVKVKEIIQLIKLPYIQVYFIMVFMVSLPHRMNDSFLSLYIKSLGGSDFLAGFAWFIAAMFEAIVFSLNKYWLKSGKENQIIFFAIIIYVIRWGLAAIIHNPMLIVGLQVLHSFSFALFYLTILQQFTKKIPAHLQATAQSGLLSIFFGAAGIVGSILGGGIFEQFGGHTLYWLMSVLSIMSIPFQFILMRKYK